MKTIEDPDVEDGKEVGRQTILGIIFTFILSISWFICQLFQYACVWYATRSEPTASNWIGSESYILWNIVLVALITVFLIPLFVGYQGEDRVRVRMNIVSPGKSNDGGTKYVVYGPGLYFFPGPLETEGFETDIERDVPHFSEVFTSTVASKSIQMQLMLIEVPYSRRLSAFFQNGKTESDRFEILKGIMTIARQTAESEASKYSDVEEARKNQAEIAERVKNAIVDKAKEYGFLIKEVAFALCDYSADVQDALNNAMKARAFTEIVTALIGAGVPAKDAIAHAGALSGNGTQIKHTSFDLNVNSELAEAIAKAGPGAAAALAAYAAGRGTPQNTTNNKNSKKKGTP